MGSHITGFQFQLDYCSTCLGESVFMGSALGSRLQVPSSDPMAAALLAAAADVSREEVAVITQCASLGEPLTVLPPSSFFFASLHVTDR